MKQKNEKWLPQLYTRKVVEALWKLYEDSEKEDARRRLKYWEIDEVPASVI